MISEHWLRLHLLSLSLSIHSLTYVFHSQHRLYMYIQWSACQIFGLGYHFYLFLDLLIRKMALLHRIYRNFHLKLQNSHGGDLVLIGFWHQPSQSFQRKDGSLFLRCHFYQVLSQVHKSFFLRYQWQLEIS